ncbi:MAG TPA: hypothetical protein VID93_00850, partial [Acidimicrobiales bacterium]
MTAHQPGRRGRARSAAAVGLGIAFAVGAWSCGVSPESQPRAVDRQDILFGLAETSTSTTTTTVPLTVAQTTIPPATTIPV